MAAIANIQLTRENDHKPIWQFDPKSPGMILSR